MLRPALLFLSTYTCPGWRLFEE